METDEWWITVMGDITIIYFMVILDIDNIDNSYNSKMSKLKVFYETLFIL